MVENAACYNPMPSAARATNSKSATKRIETAKLSYIAPVLMIIVAASLPLPGALTYDLIPAHYNVSAGGFVQTFARVSNLSLIHI